MDRTVVKNSEFYFILEKIRKQTPEESLALMKKAGILDENGKLTEHYRRNDEKSSDIQ